jgi:ribosomal protein L33
MKARVTKTQKELICQVKKDGNYINVKNPKQTTKK